MVPAACVLYPRSTGAMSVIQHAFVVAELSTCFIFPVT